MSSPRPSRPRKYSCQTSQDHVTGISYRYEEQDDIVDMVFPPIGKNGLDPEVDVEQFSSFQFWRIPVMDMNTLDLEVFK